MNIDTWTAVQRRFVSRLPRITGEISPDNWLVVDERGVVVVTVSPETYWETDDPVAAQTRAYLLAAAPEMYELIESLSTAYDHDKSSHDLAATLYDLRCRALQLLAKIEEGAK